MDLRRPLVALCLAALAVLATATPALAHAELRSSTPAQGAALDAVPKQLLLTFSEPVSPMEITVAGSPGTQWTLGQIAVEGPTVTVPVVRAVGPAGPYAITWKVQAEDGDPISGAINFTLTVPASPGPTTTTPPATGPPGPVLTTDGSTTPVPAPAAAPADDGGVPPWVWVLIGLVVVLVAGLLIARRSRATPAAPGDEPERTEP
ncbi:MAG TPA: copper resistance CopC family protein [Actinophytocola sp.]|uniref:copper resistance CopC family protein n=1 Tax=Actinophytocola sp. TaxID=1872138 RepID=UPI002DDDB0BA|nr:copper resistance CopC family protein [Actinophytocola sp.]HEV2783304.1 copper resistance CopC family protein [Actinophytocola sp.]